MNRATPLPLVLVLGVAVASSACGSPGHLTGAGGAGGATGTGGAGGGACVLEFNTFAEGTSISIPGSDGCFTNCTCLPGPQVTCAPLSCQPDGGPIVCVFDAVYRYGQTGGLVAYQDEATLTPLLSYGYARHDVRANSDTACTPTLPVCNDPAALDVSDVMRDLADPSVQAALALPTPPLYGVDTRPSDGTVFSFLRADGRGFLVGAPCSSGGTATTCVVVPDGIARLITDLQALDQQQLADPSCAAFR